SALAILLASRFRRSDPRTAWVVAVGGAFVTSAVLFSAASGIFHPYYVSLLAPFTAALVGAGAAQLIGGAMNVRIFGPLAFGPVNGSRGLFAARGPGGGSAPPGDPPGARGAGPPAGFTGAAPGAPGGAIGGAGSSRSLFSAGFGAGPFDGHGSSLTQVVSYVRRHGGGTIAVASESGAASAGIA